MYPQGVWGLICLQPQLVLLIQSQQPVSQMNLFNDVKRL
uniref:Uncharacterized protein MANES_12G071800 n=1 Tax=Rhizophora mucronata TaxID=61149 RepID=A0A2P2MPB7_RHIMU